MMTLPETIPGQPEQIGWLVMTDPMEVIPTGDLHMHRGGLSCWCHPGYDDNGALVHVAADHREDFETGKRLPS